MIRYFQGWSWDRHVFLVKYMVSMHTKNTITLDDKLNQSALALDDLRLVRQIPSRYVAVPFKRMPTGYQAINDISQALMSARPLPLGEFQVDLTDRRQSFRPVHRLVAALSYALKEFDEAEVENAWQDKVWVAGNNYFKDEAGARRYLSRHSSRDGGPNYFFPEVFTYASLTGGHVIRSCCGRALDAPDDFNGYVQTLTSDDKIVRSIHYIDSRSP